MADNSSALGGGYVNASNSVAIGMGATVLVANATAIGAGTRNNESGTVSFGDDTSGYFQRLTNIANGFNANDAATFGQLNAMASVFGGTLGYDATGTFNTGICLWYGIELVSGHFVCIVCGRLSGLSELANQSCGVDDFSSGL